MKTKEISSQITGDKIHLNVQLMISRADINILIYMLKIIAVYDEN